MTWETTITLQPPFFQETEKPLAAHGTLKASTFRYSRGVAALRLANELGQLIMLPFQGQQIWHLEFNGRPLTMKSMFDQPNPTREYLETYGGFLLHCGATAMGVPTAEDNHPLHGELPNAPYQEAQLLIGEDDGGPYLGLTGGYQHTVAFSHNYVARPRVKLYAASTRVPLSLRIKNLKRSPMDLMYLAHVNFRPVDNGELLYSAPATPDHVRVRRSIPSHVSPAPGYAEFLDELAADPAKHHVLEPDLLFDPEVVFFVDYRTDDAGWAYTMQRHPDGSADFIRHRPEQLDHGVRWISRTGDQEALGMCLPATAEPEGFAAERAKGNLKTIPAGGEFACDMEVGTLTAAQTDEMTATITQIIDAEEA